MKTKERKLLKKNKEGCSTCEDKDRKIAIQSFLLDVPYETKALYEEACESFYKSSMTLPEIKFIATTLTPKYQRNAELITKERERSQVRRVGIY